VALGSALVLASALVYAAYLVAGGELVRRLGSIRLTAWAMIVSCIACIAQALVLSPGGLVSQPAPVHALSVVNALACTVLPVFMVMMAIERVGSSVAAQLGMVGPAATIAMGAVILGEPVGATQLLGTAIVIAGIFVLTVRRT
jgi:drug/metabolite transporter (DMT)-like permease